MLREIRTHLWDLARLAAPVVVTRAGVMVMALVDTIVVARHSTAELAYLGIANAPVQTLIVGLIGMMMGTLVTTANAFGGGRLAECGATWRRSMPYGFAMGAAGALICLFGEPLLRALGQSDELSRHGGAVVQVLGLGLPAHMMFVASGFFLEGIKRPLPAMVAMLAANILNLVLCVWLVFGGFGLSPMGAMGAAIATTSVRYFLAISLGIYVWTMRAQAEMAVRQPAPGGWSAWQRQRRIGYGAGASYGLESAAFAGVAIYAGWLGAMPLAAYSVALNATALVFMVATGLASATAVRVGVAHGRHDRREVALAGWLGLGATSATMLLAAGLFGFGPGLVATVYSNDPGLIAAAAPMIAVAAWMVLFDGGQAVMSHALRARGDVLLPTILHVIAYGGIMLPGCWLLAFPAGRGSTGLMEGIVLASVFAALVLAARFAWLDRRALHHA